MMLDHFIDVIRAQLSEIERSDFRTYTAELKQRSLQEIAEDILRVRRNPMLIEGEGDYPSMLQISINGCNADVSLSSSRKIGTRIFTLSAVGRICPACNGACLVPAHVVDDPATAEVWRRCFYCLAQVG